MTSWEQPVRGSLGEVFRRSPLPAGRPSCPSRVARGWQTCVHLHSASTAQVRAGCWASLSQREALRPLAATRSTAPCHEVPSPSSVGLQKSGCASPVTGVHTPCVYSAPQQSDRARGHAESLPALSGLCSRQNQVTRVLLGTYPGPCGGQELLCPSHCSGKSQRPGFPRGTSQEAAGKVVLGADLAGHWPGPAPAGCVWSPDCSHHRTPSVPVWLSLCLCPH